jgi:hypothetical protein
MNASDKSCNIAAMQLQDAARYLFASAFAVKGMRDWLNEQALAYLTKAARELGYELKPIERKDEAA